MKRCFQVHPDDNVATLLEDAEREPLMVLGQVPPVVIQAEDTIPLGHKVALKTITADSPIVKFGTTIALATTTIQTGQWVHLHNSRSQLDERSNRLDVHTGVATDIPYE